MSSNRRSPWAYLARYRGLVAIGSIGLIGTSACALAVPWLLGRTIEAIRGPNPAAIVPSLALWMVAFAVAQALIRIVSRISLFNAARKAEYDLRSDLFAHLMKQSPSFFRTYTVGDVMSRLTADVQTVRAMWGPGVLNIVNTTFMFTVAVALMIVIDWRLALFALVPYPLMVLFGKIFAGRLYRSSREVQDYLGQVSSSLQEDLGGVGVIKTYALEPARKRRFAGMADDLLARNMKLTLVRGQLIPVLTGLGSLGTVVILYFGGKAVIDDRITLGQLVQFNAYLAMLVWPTLALGWMLSLFQRGLASWNRLTAVLDHAPSIVSGTGPDLTENDIHGLVEVRDLSLELEGRNVLDRVSLDFPAGSITALVGRTGSGKSLLVEAVPRLLEVAGDTIFLDGRDVSALPLTTVRRAIGYAPQEAFLFSTSIARNIAFGIEHTSDQDGPGHAERFADMAPDMQARIRRAAEAAGLTRDLAALPDHFDTLVGERGITLSGGQRQRVALARALASDPSVLILDDSLSSVDTETERDILARLDQVMKGRTTILISHRIAAIRRAHRIAVIDEGALVELGTHEQLLAAGGVYAELYRTELEADIGVEPEVAPTAKVQQ